jgi:hypothetical protein
MKSDTMCDSLMFKWEDYIRAHAQSLNDLSDQTFSYTSPSVS